MMGLLDPMDDPRTMGLLSLGMGLLGSKGSFGSALSQAGPQALQAMRQVQQDKQRKEQQAQAQQMQQLQMQQAQMAIAEQQRAAAEAEAQRVRDDQFRSAIPAPVGAPIAQGATPFGGFAIPGAVDPKQQLLYQALLQRQIKPMDYMTAIQKDTTPIKLGAGETLLEQGTYKPLFTNPKEDSQPPSVKEYQYAVFKDGYRGTYEKWTKEQAASKASRVNVAVDAGPKAFWNDYGKQAADTLFKEREGAQSAASVLQSVQQIRGAAARGAYQGTGAELKLGAAKALGALGMPYDAKTVANTEVFNAQANKFVLDSIKQLGANPSNADREFIEKTVPRLQTDPAALPSLLSFLEGKAQGQIRTFNDKAKSVAGKPGAQFLPFDLAVPEPSSVVDFGSLK